MTAGLKLRPSAEVGEKSELVGAANPALSRGEESVETAKLTGSVPIVPIPFDANEEIGQDAC